MLDVEEGLKEKNRNNPKSRNFSSRKNGLTERGKRRVYLSLSIILRKVFRYISGGSILKILNKCTLILPLTSCSLLASQLYGWIFRGIAPTESCLEHR